jgi:hypothetical protein
LVLVNIRKAYKLYYYNIILRIENTKTQTDAPCIINGLNFPLHGCKFEDTCTKYNPAGTIKNSYGVIHLNPCTHGGGSGHKCWRDLMTQSNLAGWGNMDFNRNLHPKISSVAVVPECKAADKQEAVLNKLKNAKCEL